ncbi:MAG: hypothetical protein JWS10_1352 [Cypionkella sp.]|uniref:hypothetical protein n=1 Tax=Cypionkella sp. TaxID=2811411 RepID=UPI00261BDC5C|nr:hypothetical protein [Cypionkella sp.]MDB5658737.1 hypothetical protein [Cypionkella sp.]MDB5664819.1 hypothetical protein [Cypionkella sp.]
MYLRFVTERVSKHDGRREGFFQTCYSVWRGAETPEFAVKELRLLLDWFDANLDEPTAFNRSTSKKNMVNRNGVGLSWFRPEASKHIAKAFDAAAIIEQFGFPVTVLKSTQPGYIVFEDTFQIVAIPFANTPN